MLNMVHTSSGLGLKGQTRYSAKAESTLLCSCQLLPSLPGGRRSWLEQAESLAVWPWTCLPPTAGEGRRRAEKVTFWNAVLSEKPQNEIKL